MSSFVLRAANVLIDVVVIVVVLVVAVVVVVVVVLLLQVVVRAVSTSQVVVVLFSTHSRSISSSSWTMEQSSYCIRCMSCLLGPKPTKPSYLERCR